MYGNLEEFDDLPFKMALFGIGNISLSRWWSQIFFYFHPYLGKMFTLTIIFQLGWFNHQPALFGIGNISLYIQNPPNTIVF